MAQNFQQLEKQIRDLDAKIQRLGGVGFIDVDAAILKMNGDLIQANKAVKDLLDEVDDLENVFIGISKTLKNVVRDLENSTKTSTLITRSFSKLESIASKLVEHKKDEEILTVKQLTSLAKKAKVEYDNLVLNRDIAKEQLKGLDKSSAYYKKLNSAYLEANAALKKKGSYLEKIVKYSA